MIAAINPIPHANQNRDLNFAHKNLLFYVAPHLSREDGAF